MASLEAVRALPILVGMLEDERAKDLVVGREGWAAKHWEIVGEHNVRVIGARHVGKTWALKFAVKQHPSWAKPVLIDAGDCESAADLAWRVTHELSAHGIVPREWAARVSQWHAKLAEPIQAKPTAPWSMVMHGTLQHASTFAGMQMPVLVLDGFGPLAYRMCDAGALDDARKLFEIVGSFPKDWPRLRCVITGCDELDAALGTAYGTAPHPLSEGFSAVEVPPLAHEDAQYLAACLLLGESIVCSNLDEVADAVATACGENAFLIHNTIDWMAQFQPSIWTPERVLDVPTVVGRSSAFAPATEPDPAGRDNGAHELSAAAQMLDTLNEPVESNADGDDSPHPVLQLPPAFVLLERPDTVEQTARPENSRAVEAVAVQWRKLKPIGSGAFLVATSPAYFYISDSEHGTSVEGELDPPSFVALGPLPGPMSGMRALVEARRALLALEDGPTVLGVESDQTLLRRGLDLLHRSSYESALEVYQELARRTRADGAAEVAAASLVNAAYALARLHRYDDAVGVCDSLIRQYGEDSRPTVLACVALALVNKSAALIAMGRASDAAVVSRALLSCTAPDAHSIFAEAIASAHFNLAFALAQLGQETEAISAYEAVVATYGTAQSGSMRKLGADAAYNIAVLHRKAQRRVQAIEACETALALYNAHVRAQALRIVMYLRLHLVGEALAALADALRAFDPGSPQRALLLAELLREAAESPSLTRMLVAACMNEGDDVAAAVLLSVQRALSRMAEESERIAVLEDVLGSLFAEHDTVQQALHVLRAARLRAAGDATATQSLPEPLRALLA